MDLNNKVIGVLNINHGKKVKAFFKKNGANVSNFSFVNTRSIVDGMRFFGFRNNIFNSFSRAEVELYNLTVITLPIEESNTDLKKSRFFVKVGIENFRLLNQYLHKHWKKYKGYKDKWEVFSGGEAYFCSESIVVSDEHFHTVVKYPDLPTDALVTTHEFLSLLDIDLLNKSLSYYSSSSFKEKESSENSKNMKYFIKITKNNVYILNRFLHRNAHRYKGYDTNWEVQITDEDSVFCSESIPFLNRFVHSIPLQQTVFEKDSSFKIIDDLKFFAMFDRELYLEFLAITPVMKKRKKATEKSKSFYSKPDFSPSDMIILKHLLDSNIKFDSNDFNFYKSLFQLGYDYSVNTRIY